MDSSHSADAEGAALLRFLVGEEPHTTPRPDTFSAWLAFASRQRLVPLLYHFVEDQGIELTDEQFVELHDAQVEVMSVAARHDQQLIDLGELLRPVEVAFAALKGAAVANLDYPDPSWRQYGDLDVLVLGDDLQQVCELLTEDGWRRGYPIPEGHERFTHAITMTYGRGRELDVHQRLAHRAVGLRIPVPEMLRRRVHFEIAGVDVSALSVEDRMIHAAVHAEMSRLESRRLSSVADVLLLATDRKALAEEVIGRAEMWRIRPLVERSIQSAFSIADLALPVEWALAMARPIRSRDRLIEAAYPSGDRRPMREELAHLRLMSTWSDRWLYMKSFLLTGDDYGRQNNRSGPIAQGRYLIGRLRDR